MIVEINNKNNFNGLVTIGTKYDKELKHLTSVLIIKRYNNNDDKQYMIFIDNPFNVDDINFLYSSISQFLTMTINDVKTQHPDINNEDLKCFLSEMIDEVFGQDEESYMFKKLYFTKEELPKHLDNIFTICSNNCKINICDYMNKVCKSYNIKIKKDFMPIYSSEIDCD